MLSEFILENKLPASFASTARKWFIPIGQQLSQLVNDQPATLFLGINGCQGSGKSTLASFLNCYLSEEKSLKVINLSLDDFYLSEQARSRLADEVHPLFATRGVPGTHNISLLEHTLHCLKNGQQVALPSFNKALDNPEPEQLWPTSPRKIDVVILEGWCWGVSMQSQAELIKPINALEQTQDAKAIWRSYVNQQLATCYMPLYKSMDKWLMLKAPSFDCVRSWRWQQEQKLAARMGHSATKTKVMNQAQVLQFISYFQRLTEHALATLPAQCDLVLSLDADRKIIAKQGAL